MRCVSSMLAETDDMTGCRGGRVGRSERESEQGRRRATGRLAYASKASSRMTRDSNPLSLSWSSTHTLFPPPPLSSDLQFIMAVPNVSLTCTLLLSHKDRCLSGLLSPSLTSQYYAILSIPKTASLYVPLRTGPRLCLEGDMDAVLLLLRLRWREGRGSSGR